MYHVRVVRTLVSKRLNELISTDLLCSLFGNFIQFWHCQSQPLYAAFSGSFAVHQLRSCSLYLGCRGPPLPRYLARYLHPSFKLGQGGE